VFGRPDAPRLFDLVKPSDERLRLAFWFAMRNTLVAKDLEQASRIAYGAGRRDARFGRVVTLAGQLIAGAQADGGTELICSLSDYFYNCQAT
jgi:structural maintenance of chromosome 4